jgi:hypothetical protein
MRWGCYVAHVVDIQSVSRGWMECFEIVSKIWTLGKPDWIQGNIIPRKRGLSRYLCHNRSIYERKRITTDHVIHASNDMGRKRSESFVLTNVHAFRYARDVDFNFRCTNRLVARNMHGRVRIVSRPLRKIMPAEGCRLSQWIAGIERFNLCEKSVVFIDEVSHQTRDCGSDTRSKA